MKVRKLGTAGTDEREDLLDLLDGWPFPPSRNARDFFRRYLDCDPTFEQRNVWVSEIEGRLVSCVQIFPRRIFLLGNTVPAGGIGSVFTRPEFRRRGIAEQLLVAAARDMRRRGFLISMLWATRARWYHRLGWSPRVQEEWTVAPGEAAPGLGVEGAANEGPDIEVSPFSEQDLPEVQRLWSRYTSERDGAVARDLADWGGSLQLAGDPEETFLVARVQGRLASYLRFCAVGGDWQALEWARQLGAGEEAGLASLVALFWQAVRLARMGSDARHPELRLPRIGDALLVRKLRDSGLELEADHEDHGEDGDARAPVEDSKRPQWMLRCLNAPELCRRLGMSADGDVLARALPPDRFHFWPADRF